MNVLTGDIRMMKWLEHYDENVYAYLATHKDKHIPAVIDYWREANGFLVVIEEIVQGNTFDIIINDRTMPDKKKLQYFFDLLEGLEFLHNAPKPIIHRDLKPSNIMVTDKGEVMILDYDAAKIYKPDNSGDTTFFGTDGVAAPEQYGFMQSDPRSDIYAVGRMLAAAFPDNSRIQKIAAKATSFDPANRYRSARELSDVLGRRLSPDTRIKPLFPPPGFRSRKIWKMILATLFYLYMFLTIYDFHAVDDPVMNNVERVILIILTLVGLDICNSWTGIFDVLPFVTHRNFFLRSLFKFLFVLAAAMVLIATASLVIVIINHIIAT